MKLHLAVLLLYCVSSLLCDESEKALDEDDSKEKSHEKNDGPIDHSAFLEIDDADHLQIQNSKASKLKMRKLIKQIDNDKDGKISEKELGDWIRDVISKHVTDEGVKQMPKIDKDGDNHATWEEYKAAAGYSEGNKAEPRKSSKKSKKKDKKKFDLADLDHDGKLSHYELGVMIHPNEASRMSEVVVNEFLEGLDKNKDGKLSAKEFSGGAEAGVNEIDKTFSTLDTDKDGLLNGKELGDWLAPVDEDPFLFEAKSLRESIDGDQDGFMTEKEIFKHYAEFATSRATKYGQLLKPDEDPKEPKKTTEEKVEL